MILDSQLAQQIVDRTMAIIGYNINVMNQAGVIIGSGEKNRIGQVHDGAILALKHGDSVELTAESCVALKGGETGHQYGVEKSAASGGNRRNHRRAEGYS